jgi:hypothetical protein
LGLGVDIDAAGASCDHIGFCLCKLGAVVPIVYSKKHVARADSLIVLDFQCSHIT